MPQIFTKETAVTASHLPDKGRLRELDSHELLRVESGQRQSIATFSEITALGEWFTKFSFPTVLPSNKPIPTALLHDHIQRGGGSFVTKVALGSDAESQFPATAEVIATDAGLDLRLHIVPIHYGVWEKGQFDSISESQLALAAAAAVAPQFLLALESGVATTQCSTKKAFTTSITPDHGTPLAVLFDGFSGRQDSLQTASHLTGNQQMSLRQATHLHGKSRPDASMLSSAAAGSQVAAGVPIRSLQRRELPRHVLYLPTAVNEAGKQRIVSLREGMAESGMNFQDLAMISAALGFTAHVVGDTQREQAIERVFTPEHADAPLHEIVLR